MPLDAAIGHEADEAYSVFGSYLASVMNILRNVVDYVYRVFTWIIQQIHENPWASMTGAVNIMILLGA